MAWKLLCALEERGYPELAERARFLNKRDQFVMKYDPVEIEKRERAERQRRADTKRRKDEKSSSSLSSKKSEVSKRSRVDSPRSTTDTP